MPLTLEEAIARVPGWAAAPDLSTSVLSGGITNQNFRVDVGGESFVLRMPGADTELLGINRQHEHAANLLAGQLGIAPEVYYFIQPEGYLVTRFVTARPILPDEITQPANIRRVAETVRRIHAMPDIPGIFDIHQVIRDYSTTARRYQVAFPENFDWLTRQLQQAEQLLKRLPGATHPCHNDLLNANFLTNDQLTILDWEYSGMGDIFFDLANFSDHHNLSDEQDRWLLQCYFDRQPEAGEWAHLKIMKIMSDLREATWGLVQIGISRLDFDFREYADRFFGRVFNQINNPHWNEWLMEVSKDE